MTAIQVGDKAPLFTAQAHDGSTVALSDLIGRKAGVVFFYPRDGSAMCTAEAGAFRDSHEAFVAAGAAGIGISGDSLDRHRAFAEQRKLPLLLVSDEDGSIRRAFGVPKTLGLLPGRVTYVIDREGIVRHIFNSQFSAGQHVHEALAILRRFTP